MITFCLPQPHGGRLSGRTHVERFRIRRSSVPEARRHVEATLIAWKLGLLIEPATLIASELATNVIAHAKGIGDYFDVGLRRRDGVLVIEVSDSYQWGMPEKVPEPEPEAYATGGRGLVIVEALSEKWGVRPRFPGKTVWAHLPVCGEAESNSPPTESVCAGHGDWSIVGGPHAREADRAPTPEGHTP